MRSPCAGVRVCGASCAPGRAVPSCARAVDKRDGLWGRPRSARRPSRRRGRAGRRGEPVSARRRGGAVASSAGSTVPGRRDRAACRPSGRRAVTAWDIAASTARRPARRRRPAAARPGRPGEGRTRSGWRRPPTDRVDEDSHRPAGEMGIEWGRRAAVIRAPARRANQQRRDEGANERAASHLPRTVRGYRGRQAGRGAAEATGCR